MTTQPQRTRFTYEDYLALPDYERYELIDGELVMVPPPSWTHQGVVLDLGASLKAFAARRALGSVSIAPFNVTLPDDTVVQPDVLFISAGRESIITESAAQGAPDLVVEILSPSTARYDKTTKRDIYARNGVREYWQVDTDARSVTVLLLGDGGYELGGTYGPGDTLTSSVLPGLNLDLGDVFA